MHTPARSRNEDYSALVRGHYGPAPRRRAADSRTASTAARRTTSVAMSADTGADVLGPAHVEAPLEEYVVDRPEPNGPPADVVIAPAESLDRSRFG